MSEFVAFLREAGAHHDLVRWVESTAPTLDETWARCPRGDWLLAIAARLGAPRASLSQAALACARLAAEGVEDPLVHEAIRQAEGAVAGAVSRERVAATRARLEAMAAGAAGWQEVSVLAAAASALASLDDPMAAAAAAAHAVEAAVAGVGDCAMLPALGHMQRETARLVRSLVPCPSLPPDGAQGR